MLFASQPFQVVIEAVVGDGYAGDIAIDDTSFTTGCILANVNLVTVSTPPTTTLDPSSCEAKGEFTCVSDQSCISPWQVCDFTPQCQDGSDEKDCGTCTFDGLNGTLCGWKDYSVYEHEWKLKTGSIPYGPGGDHTTGSGYYVSVYDPDEYGYASLRTPVFGPTAAECQLTFWYYMDFDEDDFDYSSISVYYRNDYGGYFSFQFIERISESTGPQWKQATISIGRRQDRFEIGKSIIYSKSTIDYHFLS